MRSGSDRSNEDRRSCVTEVRGSVILAGYSATRGRGLAAVTLQQVEMMMMAATKTFWKPIAGRCRKVLAVRRPVVCSRWCDVLCVKHWRAPSPFIGATM